MKGRCLVIALGSFICLGSWADGLDQWHVRRNQPQGERLSSVTFGNGRFVAVGKNGTVLTSLDGTAWVAQNPPVTNDLRTVSFGNGLFLAVAWRYFIATSPDGSNWTVSQLTDNTLFDVAFGNGLFIATRPQDKVAYFFSTNATDWLWGVTDIPGVVGTIAYCNSRFVAAGVRFYHRPQLPIPCKD